MPVSSFSPQSVPELAAVAATHFGTQPIGDSPAGTTPNTDVGSSLGPLFESAALLCAFIQNEIEYTNRILRLGTIPDPPDGSVSPDSASFAAPFGVTPLGAVASVGTVTCKTPSRTNVQLVVPVGVVLATQSGVQFMIVADPGNTSYDSGSNGYIIPVGQSSVDVTVQCLTAGIGGNVGARTISQIYGTATTPMPPAVNSVFNVQPFTSGRNGESNAAFKQRFTITVSSGRVGTGLAIIAAALAVETGIIYSYGDQVNPDGTSHPGFFTLFVNLANTGTSAPGKLIDDVTASIEGTNGNVPVRPAGISYAIRGTTLLQVNASALIIPKLGYDPADVAVAAAAQYSRFLNGIGLNPDTTPTQCSLAGVYAALLRDTKIRGVPCVQDVQNLTLNGGTSDITATFGLQLVAGTTTFTHP